MTRRSTVISYLGRCSGIYVISCLGNGHLYVGKSTNMRRRQLAHIAMLRLGTHDNEHLQRAWRKYGADSFVFLEFARTSDLERCEGEAIAALQPEYNMGGVHPSRMTPEVRARIRAAMRQWHEEHPEHRSRARAIGLANRGTRRTEAERAHLSAHWKGRQFTLETRAKISVAKRRRDAEARTK